MGDNSLKIFIFLSLLLLPFAATPQVFAQDDGSYATDYEDEYSDEELVFDEIEVENFLKPVEDEYLDASFPVLSKMYWAIGKLDLTDDEAVDNYLMINECQIYRQYYQNDFEWEKIRETTRQMIERQKISFPTQFEIILPLKLGRYDTIKKEFAIAEDSRIMGMRRLDFSNNPTNKPTCSKEGEVLGYPKNIILVLNRPFSIEKVPVRPEIAEMYLEEARLKYDHLPAKMQIEEYERDAYLRLKIRVSNYKETTRGVGGDMRAVVFGKLDGIEVYADSKKMKPMYLSKIQDKRLRHFRVLRKAPAPSEAPPEEEPVEDEGEIELRDLPQ